MPIEVEGPDGTIIEFPDGTSQDVMRAAMAKHYQAPKVEKAAPAAAAPPPVNNSIPQWMGVTTRALAPYATAAGLGAAAGAPFAGVGAAPGAAGGVLSLGLADLGTGVYNLAAPMFGGQRVPLPSETIQQQYENIGIGSKPQTPAQQVFSDVVQAGAGGFGTAKGAQTLEQYLMSPTSKNVMAFLGGSPRVQTAASMGGAAAPSIATNFFGVTDPKAIAALSLGGAVLGGKAGAPKATAIPSSALTQEAQGLYKQMEQAGVQVSGQAMADLEAAARQKLAGMRYDPDTDKVVTEALNLFSKKAGQPITYEMLDKFRRSIRDLPYSEAGGKRGTTEQRAMVKALDETIDDFMNNLKPGQTTAGDAAAAASYLTKARDIRARAYRTETVENAVDAARTASVTGNNPPSYANALRTEFGKIVKNPRKMAKFDADTQTAIKDVAQGKFTERALRFIGKFAPGKGLIGLELGGAAPAFVYAPKATAATIGLQASMMGARKASNAMTSRAAQKALTTVSGAQKPGGFGWNVMSPAAQQNVLAQERLRNKMKQANK